jgi:hypothetical protein
MLVYQRDAKDSASGAWRCEEIHLTNLVMFDGHFFRYAFRILSHLDTELLTLGTNRLSGRFRPGQVRSLLEELLSKAANNVGKLVDSVHKFAIWWSDAETMISTLKNQITSVDGQSMSPIRIEMVRHNWDVLRKDYVEYKTSVSHMQFLLAQSDPTILTSDQHPT